MAELTGDERVAYIYARAVRDADMSLAAMRHVRTNLAAVDPDNALLADYDAQITVAEVGLLALIKLFQTVEPGTDRGIDGWVVRAYDVYHQGSDTWRT